MPLPIESQVQATLREHEDRLTDLILGAWSDSASDRAKYGFKRTHRCMVHEKIVGGLRVVFSGVPNVAINEKHETAYIIFGQTVIARIKHGDNRGLGKNNHTQSSFAFVSAGSEPWELPLGLPDIQRVDITYLLNDMETRIEAVMVTGRDGERPLWSYPLYPRRAMAVELLPSKPQPPVDPSDVVRLPSIPKEKPDDKKAG